MTNEELVSRIQAGIDVAENMVDLAAEPGIYWPDGSEIQPTG